MNRRSDQTLGLSFNQTADVISDLLEVALHTLLCLRNVYPPSTFTRVKAYGVAVYQNRHPQVRQYVAGCMRALNHELKRGIVERVTFVFKDANTGVALERYIFEVGFPMGLSAFKEDGQKDRGIRNSPQQRDLELMTQAFLTRLINLESQLVAFTEEQEITFAVVIATAEGDEPDQRPFVDYTNYEGKKMRKEDREPLHFTQEGPSPWVPATRLDGHRPRSRSPEVLADRKGKGRMRDEDDATDEPEDRGTPPRRAQVDEPVMVVKSIETGVIDINLMVQECVDKRKYFEQHADG